MEELIDLMYIYARPLLVFDQDDVPVIGCMHGRIPTSARAM